MGLATVTAARIFKGQQDGSKFGGEEAELHFETFPNTGLSKTYCVDSQVADSACSATAYLSGVKGNIRTIGVTSDVAEKDCVAQMDEKNHAASLLAWAQAAGKSTGIVTTTRITHASPAGTYAHIAHRDWEGNYQVENAGHNPDDCDDIAYQLIHKEPGRSANVILGGGRKFFYPGSTQDPESAPGNRTGDRNLVEDWLADKNGKNERFIYKEDDLNTIDPTKVDYLLGLFSDNHLEYESETNRKGDPSLSKMTEVAIKILQRNPKGYFLFVEGGRIDHAHHDNYAKRALLETIEFDKSIKLADDLTNDEDTLIVVTADHSHVMTINGYPTRGNPLLEIADYDDYTPGNPYATLSYANGPGQTPFDADENGGGCIVRNITGKNFNDPEYKQVAMVHLSSETHGGEDVIIFSKGPFSHLLTGVQQQSYIPHVMAYSSCIGNGAKFCSDTRFSGTTKNLGSTVLISMILTFLHFLNI
jgi:alkaline phosphatase